MGSFFSGFLYHTPSLYHTLSKCGHLSFFLQVCLPSGDLMSVNAAWESISCITLKAQMASPPALHPHSRIYQVTSAASNLSFPSPLCVILFQPHEERLPVEFHFIKFALSLSIVLSNKVSSFVSFWNLIHVLGGLPWCCGQS